MKNFLLKQIPYFKKLIVLAKDKKTAIWLVGGFLRDLQLNLSVKDDFDFVLDNDVEAFALAFSEMINGRLVVVDKILRNVRVVKKIKDRIINYDFSVLRAKNITEDLRKRDLTINTLTVNILSKNLVVDDLLNVACDFKQKTLNIPSDNVLKDDPLRILRIFSFSGILGFKISLKTISAIKKSKSLLSKVSPERIREELAKVLKLKDSYKVFLDMDRLGVLYEVFPELKNLKGVKQGGYHHLDVKDHSLETLRMYERKIYPMFSKLPEIKAILSESISKEFDRYSLLKIVCLFHDLGKPECKIKKRNRINFYSHEKAGSIISDNILKKYRFSNKDREFIRKIILFHLLPGYLVGNSEVTDKLKYRFFRKTDPEGVSVIVFSFSDIAATRGVMLSRSLRLRHNRLLKKMVLEYLQKKKQKPFKRILNGRDIMGNFKLPSSPLIGEILEFVEEIQNLGQVRTKKQALFRVKEFLTIKRG